MMGLAQKYNWLLSQQLHMWNYHGFKQDTK